MQTKTSFPHLLAYLKKGMLNSTSTKYALALVLFSFSIATRYGLVDRYYDYSFEADSRRCVEETKSFYFYFQHPAKENFPDPLNAYPNYSDGHYIFSALLANLLSPVFKSGIIPTHLSDADNTLVVFSMRWSGVLFDAVAVVFTFLILLLVTQNHILSFALCLLYYLLNPQTLNVDIIRIDHYSLFASAFVMWAAVSLFYFPEKKRYYILTGIAAGLVSATKINFPFYLLMPFLIVLYLLYKKKVTVLQFGLMTLTFLLSFVFMYQRWLMYSENICQTIMTTLTVGEQWFVFWGNKNYFYYLWQQFFNHGFSWSILLFLLAGYTSFVYCLAIAVRQRNAIYLLLCAAFVLQMLLLMFSPKVARYGMIVPVWFCVFWAIGLSAFINRFRKKWIPVLLTTLLLVPVFTYSFSDYTLMMTKAKQRALSIQQTRVEAAESIKQNVNYYSVIGLQYPELSYPPVFEYPFVFTSEYLQFPFLDKEALSKLYPPAFHDLKNHFNYIMLSNKEKNFHLLTLKQYQFDTLFIQQWKNFYDSLPSYFAAQCFSSAYENYGVKNLCIYKVSDSVLYQGISTIHASSKGTDLYWSYEHPLGANAYNFQIQIAEDSLMRWLVYGSRDGYPSKYRAKNNPRLMNANAISFVPLKINRAFEEGQFDFMLDGVSAAERKVEIENFFAGTLVAMKESDVTFQQAIQQKFKTDAKEFFSVTQSLYTEDILQMHLADYLRAAQLAIDTNTLSSNLQTESTWQFHLPVELQKGKNYYWRVRFKDKDVVLSRWSNTACLKL